MAAIVYRLRSVTSSALSVTYCNISTLSITGFVLGIMHTVVYPPLAAALEPVLIVSLCSSPGSLKCALRSTSPGITIQPDASITSSACDSSIFSSIAAINPSLISTSITLSVLLAGSSTLPSLISMFIRPISPLSFSLQKYWLVQASQNNIPVYNPRQDF